MGNLVWKVLSMGAGIVASKIATTTATKTWKMTTGKSPRSAKDPNASIIEAAIYAAISTGALAAAKMYAERRAADYYTKSAGHPPQALVKRAEEEAKEAQKGKSQAPVVVMK